MRGGNTLSKMFIGWFIREAGVEGLLQGFPFSSKSLHKGQIPSRGESFETLWGLVIMNTFEKGLYWKNKQTLSALRTSRGRKYTSWNRCIFFGQRKRYMTKQSYKFWHEGDIIWKQEHGCEGVDVQKGAGEWIILETECPVAKKPVYRKRKEALFGLILWEGSRWR